MHQELFSTQALPRPTGGAYSAPQTLIAEFKGWSTQKGREKGRERERDGRRREEKEGMEEWRGERKETGRGNF